MKALSRIFPWLLVVALAAYIWWRQSPSSATPVAEAVVAGKVELQSEVRGSGGTSAEITLRRPAGSSGRLHLVIPAGMVLNGGTEVQRLMVAKPIVVDLDDDNPEVTHVVETYCIDEFRTAPVEGVVLNVDAPQAGDGGGGYGVETEPLHKLAECLADQDLPQADRQLAVWAVSENLMEKSRDDATAAIVAGLTSKMGEERRKQVEAKRSQVHEAAPNLSDQTINELMDKEMQDGQAELDRIAAQTADEQVRHFVERDRDAMSKCGFPVATLQIFQ